MNYTEDISLPVFTQEYKQTIAVTDRYVAKEIEILSIIRVQASSSYSKLFTDNGSMVLVSKPLSWFAQQLPDEQFVRVHQSHLVNRSFIVTKEEKTPELLLTTGERIRISKQKMSDIRHNRLQL